MSLPGADIDTLLVVPRHIDRQEFFSSFQESLEEHKSVTNVRVSDTYGCLSSQKIKILVLLSLSLGSARGVCPRAKI